MGTQVVIKNLENISASPLPTPTESLERILGVDKNSKLWRTARLLGLKFGKITSIVKWIAVDGIRLPKPIWVIGTSAI
jgi:hypothetical protein